jgi:hypothetical protein
VVRHLPLRERLVKVTLVELVSTLDQAVTVVAEVAVLRKQAGLITLPYL